MASEYQLTPAAGDLLPRSTGFAGQHVYSLIDCFRALQRRKVTLIYVSAICTLAAGLFSVFQPRMYQSTSSVEIQGINENFLNTGDIFPATALSTGDWSAYVQTQAEILQQDALIEQVVRALRLDARPEYEGSSHGADTRATSSALMVRNAIAAMKKHLTIAPVRGSRIVKIVCEARDPNLAADIANTLAQALIEANVESRQRTAQQTYDALNVQLTVASRRLIDAENRLSEAQGSRQISSPGQGRAPLALLRREVERSRRTYESMSQRADDARVASSIRQPNIRLVGPAQAAAHAYKPNLPLNLALGIAGGLIAGIAFIMIQEQSSAIVRVPGEAGVSLALPELGAIPRMRGSTFPAPGLCRLDHDTRRPDRTAWGERAHVSESFRATLASILSPNLSGRHPRIFMVTSSLPMEGKTTIVSHLGLSLTEIGKKVLLVDGDMRRPSLHRFFDRANSWGLSDILREKNAIEDLPLDVLVTKTAIPDLYLLPSGTMADNVTSLLWSGRIARLLPRFCEVFDHLIVDAPPFLEFADARIMARYADQLLLVVRANYTDCRAAQAVVRRLLLDEIPVRGVILNCSDPRNGFYCGSDSNLMQ